MIGETLKNRFSRKTLKAWAAKAKDGSIDRREFLALATIFGALRRDPDRTPAQQQTQRVAGTIDKVEGKTLYIKSASGPVTLTLTDNAVIVARVKATAADIGAGDYVASGGVPQPDGTQKAVELRIFPDSMRGNGDGHRPGWPGAPNGTMTNGAVGQTVSSVDGPVLTVKYRDGEKKLIVGPSVPVQRLEIADRSELKSGAAVAAGAATKQPDGTFTAARIDVGRGEIAARRPTHTLAWAAGYLQGVGPPVRSSEFGASDDRETDEIRVPHGLPRRVLGHSSRGGEG